MNTNTNNNTNININNGSINFMTMGNNSHSNIKNN